jgi:hypothetical protein
MSRLAPLALALAVISTSSSVRGEGVRAPRCLPRCEAVIVPCRPIGPGNEAETDHRLCAFAPDLTNAGAIALGRPMPLAMARAVSEVLMGRCVADLDPAEELRECRKPAATSFGPRFLHRRLEAATR